MMSPSNYLLFMPTALQMTELRTSISLTIPQTLWRWRLNFPVRAAKVKSSKSITLSRRRSKPVASPRVREVRPGQAGALPAAQAVEAPAAVVAAEGGMVRVRVEAALAEETPQTQQTFAEWSRSSKLKSA